MTPEWWWALIVLGLPSVGWVGGVIAPLIGPTIEARRRRRRVGERLTRQATEKRNAALERWSKAVRDVLSVLEDWAEERKHADEPRYVSLRVSLYQHTDLAMTRVEVVEHALTGLLLTLRQGPLWDAVTALTARLRSAIPSKTTADDPLPEIGSLPTAITEIRSELLSILSLAAQDETKKVPKQIRAPSAPDKDHVARK